MVNEDGLELGGLHLNDIKPEISISISTDSDGSGTEMTPITPPKITTIEQFYERRKSKLDPARMMFKTSINNIIRKSNLFHLENEK
jgi:hypothetical protein